MKRILGIFTILAFLVSCSSNFTPDGKIIEKEIDINTFTELEISSGIVVEFSQSDKDSAVIETFESVIPYVNVSNLGNSLKISLDKDSPFDYISTLKVILFAKNLSEVKITGGSHLEALTDITSTNFEIYLSESSFTMKENKTLTIESSLLVNLDAGSTCKVAGTSETFTAGLTGGSSFSTFDFTAEEVNVNVNMRSLMEISVTKKFIFTADGASIIKYKGEGKGTLYASGGSKIESL